MANINSVPAAPGTAVQAVAAPAAIGAAGGQLHPQQPPAQGIQQPAEMTLFNDPAAQQLAPASASVGSFDAQIGGMSFPRIKVQNTGVFLYPVGGEATALGDATRMHMVIIQTAAHINRLAFNKAYDPHDTETPVVICRSANGVKPDADVEHKQSLTCNTCRLNAKGSSGQGRAKWCKYKLPVVAVPCMMEDNGQGGMVPRFLPELYQFSINSVTLLGDSYEAQNMFNLSDYDRKLSTIAGGLKVNQVVTAACLDQRPGSISKILFTSSYILTDADVQQLSQIVASCPYDINDMLGIRDEPDAPPAAPAPSPSPAGHSTVAATQPAHAAMVGQPAVGPAAGPAPAPQAQQPAPAPAVPAGPAPVAAPAAVPGPTVGPTPGVELHGGLGPSTADTSAVSNGPVAAPVGVPAGSVPGSAAGPVTGQVPPAPAAAGPAAPPPPATQAAPAVEAPGPAAPPPPAPPMAAQVPTVPQAAVAVDSSVPGTSQPGPDAVAVEGDGLAW